MNKEEIGLFVRTERQRQKLSQKELAEKAGISRYQSVLELENGQFNYGVEVLIKIANALNCFVTILNPGSKGELDAIDCNAFYIDFSKIESAKEEQPKTKLVLKRRIKKIK